MKKIISAIIKIIALTSVFTLTACGGTTESVSESVSDSADTTEYSETLEIKTEGNSPYAVHGAISVDSADLVDKNGEKFQLCGMSTHGLAWFPQYVNYDAFKTMRDEWNTNCVRLAMYTYEYGGYCNGGDKDNLKNLIKSGVEYADQLGMYVIIDWHVLNDKDPNVYKSEALEFFGEMSELYKDHDNIIYEICNEPNSGPEWADIKSYAEEVIPVIRENDSNAVIIVGTPTWSQDIDKAQQEPLDYDNVMYALHFYADTHTDWLLKRVDDCVSNGLPVFISEFNICDASGRGNVNTYEGEKWHDLIEKYNLSYMCWSLANGEDSCCVISSDCDKLSDWTDDDLSETGKIITEWFKGSE